MNVYIGKSINDIDINSNNIEFSDELLQFLYINKNNIKTDLFLKLDPYSDTVLGCDDLVELNSVCLTILESNILKGYRDYSNAVKTIKNVYTISKEAILQKNNLVFVGD